MDVLNLKSYRRSPRKATANSQSVVRAARRAVLETLEGRQLMAGDPAILQTVPFTLGFAIGGATPTVGRLTMIILMAIWCAVLYLAVKELTQKRWAGIVIAMYFALCVWPTFPYAYQHFIADLWLTVTLLFAIWGERDVLTKGWQWAGAFLALAMWTSVSEGGPALFTFFGCWAWTDVAAKRRPMRTNCRLIWS